MSHMLVRFLAALLTSIVSANLLARDIEGYVYDDAGRAVAGATISAFVPESSDQRLHRILSTRPHRAAVKPVPSDSRGAFRLTGVPDGVIEIETIAGGYAPRMLTHLPGQAPLTVNLTSTATVDGTVKAGGKPVAGATVTWVGNNEHFVSVVTDATGRYRIADPSKWAYDVFVFHPDFAPAAGLRRQPEPRHELEKGVLVRGTVANPDSSPASNARIYVDGLPLGATDGDGRFAVRAPSQYRNLRATLETNVGAAPRGDDITITLAKGRRLDGTVRLDKSPLAGATVVLHRHGLEFERQISVVTDASGRFAATPLLPGRYVAFPMIGVNSPVRPADHRRPMEEGGEPNLIDLRTRLTASHDVDLLRLTQVTGRVIDAQGEPVAGAEVMLTHAGAPALHVLADPLNVIRTTPAGTFALTLPPEAAERFEVVGTKPGFGFFRSEPFAASDLRGRAITVTFGDVTEIRGRVVDAAGQPVSGALVVFASADEVATMRDVTVLLEPHFQRRAVRTGSAGEFVLNLPAGTYDFAADADGYQIATAIDQEISGQEDVLTLELQPGATIRGRVARDGAGVAGVHVSIMGSRITRGDSEIVTRADGSFEIAGLAPGTYRVMFNKHDEMISETRTVDAPGVVAVELPLTGTIRGRVVAADTGEPVQQLIVSIEPVAGRTTRLLPTTRSATMHRDIRAENGRFELVVPAGRHRIVAGAPGFGGGEAVEVELAEGEVEEVEIGLSRGATITGRVRDESGQPVADAQVMIVSDERPLRDRGRFARRFGSSHAQTDENGHFTLTGVDSGAAILNVRKQGFLPFQKEIVGASADSLDIQLSRGLAITGVVLYNSRPVAGADIGASTPVVGADHQGTRTDESGRFTLSGLLPATYTIYAGKEGIGHTETRVDVNTERRVTINIDARPTGVVYGHVAGLPHGRLMRSVVVAHGERGAAEGVIREDGSYRIENVPAGAMRVAAQVETREESRSSVEKVVEVREGAELRVDLEFSEAARVHGQVTLQGRPISGARVVLVGPGGVMTSDTTRNGAYEVTLPLLGAYRVFVHAEEVPGGQYQAAHTIDASRRIDIELREQIVSGVVVDAATRIPIAGAIVTLAPEVDPENQIFGEAPTNTDGRFTIITGASGRLRLHASASGYGQRSMPADLGAAPAPNFVIELSAVASSRVRVVDARTGMPLEAHLTVTDENGVYVSARAERQADGSLMMSLRSGRYIVTAVVGGFGTAKAQLTAPGSVEIRVTPEP